MWVVYGIKNCDSVKKTCSWLDAHQIKYRLHDYRTDGLDQALLQSFIDALGVDAVLNQRSNSWRQLSAEQKQLKDNIQALHLMLSNPTLIKRPILDTGAKLIVGFNTYDFQALL